MLPVTALTSYMFCPRKLFIEKVMGIVEFPKDIMVKGSIKHQVYELMNNQEESIITSLKTPNLDAIIDIYSRKYSEILRKTILKYRKSLLMAKLTPMTVFSQLLKIFRAEAKSRAENIFKFMLKNKVYGEELWLALTPKIKSEYKVDSKELELVGKIDQIEISEKLIIPIELKSGKAPETGAWENHKIQLAAYAMLLENKFNISINQGTVRYIDSNEDRIIEINPFLRDQVKELITKVNSLLKSRKLPPIEKNVNKCNACNLKDTCHSQEVISKAKSLNMT